MDEKSKLLAQIVEWFHNGSTYDEIEQIIEKVEQVLEAENPKTVTSFLA